MSRGRGRPGWLEPTLRQRCPRCGDGVLFEGALRMRSHCSRCGLDFIGRDGAQYGGAVVLAYAVGGIAALLVLAVFLQFGALSGFAVWGTVAAAVIGVVASFRSCKAFWTWLLYRSGQLDGS